MRPPRSSSARVLCCPVCTGVDVEPSHARRWDRLLRFLSLGLLRPYRCIRCWNRFWRPR